jgi:signal transduction histidine kinase
MDDERQSRVIRWLGQEAKMKEIAAKNRQLELSLLSSQKQLLEQEQKNARQQLKEQAAELKMQKMRNDEKQLKIDLQAQQIAYNRLLIVAGACMLLLTVIIAYFIIRRIRHRLQRNQQRHMQTIDEIAYINSHQTRAPVATLLGLMNLIKMDMGNGIYNPHLLNLVDQTVKKMDEIVRQVSDRTNQISAEEKNRNA